MPVEEKSQRSGQAQRRTPEARYRHDDGRRAQSETHGNSDRRPTKDETWNEDQHSSGDRDQSWHSRQPMDWILFRDHRLDFAHHGAIVNSLLSRSTQVKTVSCYFKSASDSKWCPEMPARAVAAGMKIAKVSEPLARSYLTS